MSTMSADAKFWDGIAEKYAAKPVDDPAAFERKKAVTREHLTPDSTVLETVMRWFGKAPVVHVYDRATLVRELHEAGFVNVEERDVGGQRAMAFMVAQRPAAEES